MGSFQGMGARSADGHLGDGVAQGARRGVLWGGKQLLGGDVLDDPSPVHDDGALAHARDSGEVVGDDEEPGALGAGSIGGDRKSVV